ncbi:MAG: PilZ domain-containing protein [Bacteriovoracaceae bacterium]|nr:PilZ domain-containing protein [Bacteriovoracaceae bacterium]
MTAKVLDFNKKRLQSIENKRRQFERVLFSDLVGCYTVLDGKDAVAKVQIVDISSTGCLVEMHHKLLRESFKEGDELKLRLYFTERSFIPLILKVKRSDKQTHPELQHQVWHYGCEFDRTLPSFKAVESFIQFMYKFAEFSRVDEKNQKLYFI